MTPQLTSLLAPNGLVLARIRAALPGVMAVYLHGSHASGQAGPQSDVDLAVLLPGYGDALALWELAGRLSDLLLAPVDLFDLRAASTVMQYQVITTGRRLWSGGTQADLFECFVLSEKTALDEARAPLLADIQARGSVYGR